MKTTWADVTPGVAVELDGREWRVEKIKRLDKKRAKVTIERKGRTSKGEVRLKDPVVIVPPKKSYTQRMNDIESKHGPLHDDRGAQNRWATEKERAAVLGPGDPTQTKPPAKAKGDPWETQTDRVEKMLGKILGAHLVAEAKDEAQGYYVPPVDVSTVAAHLALFHGGIPEACRDEEGAMLKAHDAQHAAAAKGEGVLEVNHWHTEKRP